MSKEEINEYYVLFEQYIKGYHLSDNDKKDLIRLNHLIMSDAHKIHNANMLNIL